MSATSDTGGWCAARGLGVGDGDPAGMGTVGVRGNIAIEASLIGETLVCGGSVGGRHLAERSDCPQLLRRLSLGGVDGVQCAAKRVRNKASLKPKPPVVS